MTIIELEIFGLIINYVFEDAEYSIRFLFHLIVLHNKIILKII